MRRAFVALRTGRPGPVLLELPGDVANEELLDEAFAHAPVPRHRTGPDTADVARTVELLLAAERPVILAGGGVHAAEAEGELCALAELLRIPVMTSMNGKGAIPEDHALSLGTAGLSATGMVDHFLRRADTLLAVGSSLTRWWMSAAIPDGCRVIQSTIDERDLSKDYAIEHAVLGDAKLVLAAIATEAGRRLEEGRRPTGGDPADEIAAVKRAWLDEWRPLPSPTRCR
jgi:acetolactate synthase-1/2/3 large subunit